MGAGILQVPRVNKVPRPYGSRSGGDEKGGSWENGYVAQRIEDR